MRRSIVIAVLFGALGLLLWLFAQQPAAAPADLARFTPAGPVLYLEARDFGAILRDWNSSQEKKLWLAGDNYQVFSRSRLFLKLQQAQTEFAAAAGAPPNMDLLSNVAGSQSALAIYDIGKLEFVYITRLSSDRFAGGALWKLRGNYQPRQSSGINYYVKTDPATKRMAGFAAAKDYVVLATREDILAGALALIAGQSTPSVATETWFDRATREAKTPGELRMVMNFEKLTRSPHFRSYWAPQNITELKQYSGGVADATRASTELRENRVLIRIAEITPDWNEAAVAEIARFAPATAGVYRAWASPTSEQAFDLLSRELLDPRPSAPPESKSAPQVALGNGAVGSEADLETRIDEPPLDNAAGVFGPELRKLLDSTKLEAMMCVGTSRPQQDGVFVGIDTAVALVAADNWNANAIREAVADAVARQLSTGRLGLRWQDRRAGNAVYSELDGLAPIAISANGRVLIVAGSREMLGAMLTANQSPSAPARYAAAYRHSHELPNFIKLTRLIDAPQAKETTSDQPEPAFLSGNIASLGQALARVDSASITVHDTGSIVTQNVIYKWK
jgi:hypothetical protein